MDIKLKIGGQFSGVGAFDYALKRLNISFLNVYQAEWDKFARQTYLHNHSEPVYYVNDVHDTPTEEITEKYGSLDIAMFSPPCQAFSLAGKRKGEDDNRGILFYNSHEFIQKNKPRYFIFENVKGLLSDDSGKTFARWIDYLGGKSVNGNPVLFPLEESVPYHVYYQVLNAKNYGVPQNRERIFIIGIRDDADNNFTFPKPFPLTKRLKDVLEENVDEKYYLSDDNISALVDYNKRQIENNRGFSAKFRDVNTTEVMDCLKVGGDGKDDLIKVKSATSKGYEIAKIGEDSINFEHPNSKTRRGRVGVGVGQTLTTSCNQGVAIGEIRGRNIDNPKSRENGTSNCLTTVQKDNVVVENWIRGGLQQNQPFQTNGISPCLTSAMGMGGGQTPIHNYDYRIRKLTPRECFRLMDFPDTFDFSVVSSTQAYKQAGNSIAVSVLYNILNKLLIK